MAKNGENEIRKCICSMIRYSDAICLIRNFKAYYQSDNAVGGEMMKKKEKEQKTAIVATSF
jgi:hypothetical protein